MRVLESLAMVETVEDWSRVRSPSRARRRMRYGHRQNVVVRQVPRKDAPSIDGGATVFMHPDTMLDGKISPVPPAPVLSHGMWFEEAASLPVEPLFRLGLGGLLPMKSPLFAYTGNS